MLLFILAGRAEHSLCLEKAMPIYVVVSDRRTRQEYSGCDYRELRRDYVVAGKMYLVVCWKHAIRQSAPVAQLDRAADFESVGREFESPQARQHSKRLNSHH
jgi:hypothetical protein